jgi:glycosyltransferase involved in cell wall biosynthesis
MAWSHVNEFLLAGWLAAEARSARVTHLHAHYASSPATVALLVHELTGLSMSFTAHAKDAYVSSRRRLEKKLAAARFVVTCSGAVRDYLLELAPARADDIQVIHHGVSPAVLSASAGALAAESGTDLGRRQDDGNGDLPLVLAAGRLVEKKGFDDLLRALARLRADGVPFRAEIVGEGRLREPLRELARVLGLDEALSLPGALPHAVLARRYREAACFVMPSRVIDGGNRDGIPNVLLEAMAARVPAVATEVGGIPEVVVDAETGLLAPEGDVAGLASRIAEVLARPAEAAERATRAREAVLARFDLLRNADRLIDAFRQAGALPVERRSRPLRVGYILKRYPRLSETFVLEEIIEQERQGTEIHVVSLKKPDEGRFHADLARVRAGVTYLPGYILPSLKRIASANARWFGRDPGRYLATLGLALRGGDRRPFRAFLKASLVAELVDRKRIDLLHAHFATGATFMAMLVSRLTGVPFGFTAHARDIFGQHIDQQALRRKVERSSYLVVVSDATRDVLRTVVGEDLARRVRRIYNGVHPELLRRPAPAMNGGVPLLLGVGRLVEKKGFVHLLAAAALLKARGIRFRLAIAGAGPLRRDLERCADDLGVEARFLGALTHSEVVRAMRGARAVVLPAVVAADGDRDVLPTVLLEAQAMGRPVVSTRLTGIPEIVNDGDTGFLVPVGGEKELADELATALEKLVVDRPLAARLGANGRRRIAEHFNIARNVAALSACMRAAAGRGATGVAKGAVEAEGPQGADAASVARAKSGGVTVREEVAA